MNDPLLFIDSVSDSNKKNSNQETFDSRKKATSERAYHRIDDIKAMLYYKMKLLVEVITKANIRFEGTVITVNDNEIVISFENKNKAIPLNSIAYINILKNM